MTILDAVVLGLVEGITEYLPVSSTGHLILTATLLGLGRSDGVGAADGRDLQAINEAVKSFEIVIQGGAILAVAGLYWSRVSAMLRAVVVAILRLPTLRERPLDGSTLRALRLLRNLFVSFLPAAVVGILGRKWIKAHLFEPGPVCAALIVGGVVLIATGRWQRRRHALHAANERTKASTHDDDFPELTLRQAIVVGFAQVLALWPGTSRSMVTILGGIFSGLSPKRAAEYSFLLGLPTLGGATLFELARAWSGAHGGDGADGAPVARGLDGIRALIDANGGWVPVLVGLTVATISAAIAIKWLVRWLQRHSLEIFGWWRIIVGGAFIAALWLGWIAR